jgi:hypothetical protein
MAISNEPLKAGLGNVMLKLDHEKIYNFFRNILSFNGYKHVDSAKPLGHMWQV